MHDKNGTPLKKGDKVTLLCVIKETYATADFCNLTIESVEGRRPDGLKEVITLNSAVVELYEPAEPIEPVKE